VVTTKEHKVKKDLVKEDIVDSLRSMVYIIDESKGKAVVTMLSGSMFDDAADEIEYLRALCNDLSHDIICSDQFCRLCGEGVREWNHYKETHGI
jgi:hypothetical protein